MLRPTVEQNQMISILTVTDETYVPLMHPDTSVVWVWSVWQCLHLSSPASGSGHLGKAAHQLTSPHDCRGRDGAQLLPQLKLSLCLWLQERLAMALAPAALNSLCTRKVIIPLPFGQKTRERILAPSLPFALSHSQKLSRGSVLCEMWPRKRQSEGQLLCPPAFLFVRAPLLLGLHIPLLFEFYLWLFFVNYFRKETILLIIYSFCW